MEKVYLRHVINLDDLLPCEISQTQKDNYCMSPLIGSTCGSQIHTDKNWNSVCQGPRRRGTGELLFKRYILSVADDENVLELVCVNCYTTM